MGVLVFLLAVHLCTLTLAAWYGIVDHWYHIRQAWPGVLLRLLFWSLVPLALYYSLPADLANFVIYGYAAFTALHCLLHWAGQWLRRLLERRT